MKPEVTVREGNESNKAAAMLNAVLLVLEVWALGRRFLEVGFSMYEYYTQWSNTLAAIAALACIVANLRGRGERLARKLKFCACTTQLMTFSIVVFVLVPMVNASGGNGIRQLFLTGSMPVTHLLGPVLTLVSFLAFEREPSPTPQDSLQAAVFTVVYAMFAYTGNILRLFEGPYPFLRVWNMPVWQSLIWFVVLLAIAVAMAHIPRLLANWLSERYAT